MRVCVSSWTDFFAHLDMSHLGDWVSSLVDILPLRVQLCLLCPLVCPEMFTTTSAGPILAAHTHRIWSHFLLPRQYPSTLRSESLKPPWVVYRSICIHLSRWIQSRIRPQINSCVIMIKSCTVYRLLFIIAFIYLWEASLHNYWHTQISFHYFAEKMCMLNRKQLYLCLFVFITSLPALISLISLPLSIPLALPRGFRTAAAMLGYTNLQPDWCSAALNVWIKSDSPALFRTTRWRTREHHCLPVHLPNQIQEEITF